MATALAIKLSTIAFKNLGKVNKFNFTGGADEGEAVNEVEKDEENQNNQYDWDVLNYPWGINLVHYDPKELEPKYSKFVRLANYGAFTAYAAMLINVVDVIALASMGVHPMRVLYTLFNIILVAPITCAHIYLLFLVLATRNKRYVKYYMATHVLLCCVYLLFAILGEGPVNGFTKFIHIQDEITPKMGSGGRTFWLTAIITESTLYLLSFFIGVGVMLKTRSFIKVPSPPNVVA